MEMELINNAAMICISCKIMYIYSSCSYIHTQRIQYDMKREDRIFIYLKKKSRLNKEQR